MEGMEYFYELFEALPRGGPGDNKSTRRAFNTIPKHPEQPLILDIGCGPGVQSIELARLSKGRIIALDNHQTFLDKLIETAKRDALLDHIVPKNRSMLDMNFEENTFDIIWSEGALYFMGFRNGLRRCHQLLKNDQTKSEVPTRHFTASITGHFSAFHIDFLRVKRYLGYSTIGLYSSPFRLEIIAFLRRDLQ